MTTFTPDTTFYPSPGMATKAPPEAVAYVAILNPDGRDAFAAVDVNSASKTYGQTLSQVELPNSGDELHHFGWNACSSCLCPWAPHPHMERRYLPALVAHPHLRRQAEPARAAAGESD
jgi:selenium-binding protein 1